MPPAAQPASKIVNAETIRQIFGEFFMSLLPSAKQLSMNKNQRRRGRLVRNRSVIPPSAESGLRLCFRAGRYPGGLRPVNTRDRAAGRRKAKRIVGTAIAA
jgi:hypothetical protein